MDTPNRSTTPIRHIAFIMDGNGRWAKSRGLPRTMGHKAGIKRLKELISFCLFDCGIFCCSFFLFSCENFNRPHDEINFLFKYFEEYLENEKDYFIKSKIAVRIVGNLNDNRIPDSLKNEIYYITSLTKPYENHRIINLMFNYGGRQEIVDAIKLVLKDKKENIIDYENIKEYMYSKNIPDVDLLIRTSGEKRLSNYMLFYLAYTELFFVDTFWPDFTKEKLEEILKEYTKRNRRFGSV